MSQLIVTRQLRESFTQMGKARAPFDCLVECAGTPELVSKYNCLTGRHPLVEIIDKAIRYEEAMRKPGGMITSAYSSSFTELNAKFFNRLGRMRTLRHLGQMNLHLG